MENIVENAEFLIEKLLNFYKVSNVAELSDKINTSQKTISNWKIRNSINAIKKRCRELGIYNEIFGDLTLGTTINQGNSGRAGGRDYIENGNLKKEIEFDNITIGLIQKAIEKFGSEEEFQIEFMNFLKNK